MTHIDMDAAEKATLLAVADLGYFTKTEQGDPEVEDPAVYLRDAQGIDRYSIQFCLFGGGYAVNSYQYGADGSFESMTHHSEHETFIPALTALVKIIQEG